MKERFRFEFSFSASSEWYKLARMKSMSSCSKIDAFSYMPSNDDHGCKNPECVLPGCINLKLQDIVKGNPKPKRSVGQGTEPGFTKAGESTDQFWNQDLDDLLSILGLNSCGKTHPDCDVITIDESEQRSPRASKYDIGDATSFFESPQSFQTSSCQNEMHAVYVGKMHSTPNSGLKAHSQSNNCLVLLENQLLETDQAVSVGARAVPMINDVVNNNIQPIRSPSAHTTSYKTKNSSPAKRKLMGSTQCSSRLFGILSLILQAFDSPMTAELEQSCVSVMQRALEEIQNAHCYFQK